MNLPAAFVQHLRRQLGPAEADALCGALQQPPATSVRLNAGCARAFAGAQSVPWCATGRYLPARMPFTFDPLFHAGDYYVQEASSMFVEQAFRRLSAEGMPRRVLDLCAAPGGKSTLWRSLLPDGALLVANEPMRDRASVLVENLQKWGHPDVMVTCALPEAFAPLGAVFDVIATDVPCSGEGMFRKDADAVAHWSEANVTLCARRQRSIVQSVWPALRSGGWLVYSTCTFNPQEDEDNVDWICRELGAEAVAVDVPSGWHIAPDATGRGLPVYHFYPHLTRGEGFFLALLRKTSPDSAAAPVKKRTGRSGRGGRTPTGAAPARDCHSWLDTRRAWTWERHADGSIWAIGEPIAEMVARISQIVAPIAAGVEVATEKGRKLVPAHVLALSRAAVPDAFASAEVDYATAMAYLRRESLCLEAAPRGYVRLTHMGRPLGFVNHLGSRANNLYPAEWRVRSTHVPPSFEAACAAAATSPSNISQTSLS